MAQISNQKTMHTHENEQALNDAPLRDDIRELGFQLGEVIRRHGGESLYELVEEIRALSKARREGDDRAEKRLEQRIGSLNLSELEELVRALSCFFDLANLAEDRHRVRVLRSREQREYPEPRPESIGAAIRHLKAEGFDAEQMQGLLQNLDIELVFTAHPTEAKRRTVRYILQEMRRTLVERDRLDLLPGEAERLKQRIANDLTRLWQMDTLRPRRPTVLEEVGRGLYASESVWQVIPQIVRDMRAALEREYPGHTFSIPKFLRFGSWIGGDRDGNPYVTTQVTATALQTMRSAALEHHIEEADRLVRYVSVSARRHTVDPRLTEAVQHARSRWPQVIPRLDELNPREVYRQWLGVIRFRLEQTLKARPFDTPPELQNGAYTHSEELARDVEMIAASLRANGLEQLAEAELQEWLDRIRVFGFHMTRLDIRENAEQIEDAVAEVMHHLGLCPNFAELGEAAKQEILSRPLDARGVHDVSGGKLEERSKELVTLFDLLCQVVATGGTEPLGTLIISMTESPSDVLSMLWLSRFARMRREGVDDALRLPVVPLFETIDDLAHASNLLEELLNNPLYTEHVRSLGNRQTCMIGYSDGTKDGGYLAANWYLYEAQRQLAETANRRGIHLTFFHGRGGALGRGGGPAARSILSLPPASLNGTIRITEQGEVLAERYDDPDIAYRHLEQVTWATVLVAGLHAEAPDHSWTALMDKAAGASLEAYRSLVTSADFLPYFEQATPIESIETLPIGSRPTRRRGQRSLANLRAIPYVFAWTQSRQLIPAFFGLGCGFEALDPPARRALHSMYREWPFFKAVIDNAELALAKCDMAIAKEYAHLCRDDQQGRRLWSVIQEEYERSVHAVLTITGRDELLEEIPWLNRSVRVRNPYVDPLNIIQVELLRRLHTTRSANDSDARLESLYHLLRLSVQGIAAGLRTTG